MTSATQRLFVGVPVDSDALGHVDALAGRLREACTAGQWKASWVPTKNLHVTLAFLGDVDEARVEAIADALAPLGAHTPFEMELRGLGAFPSVPRPSVLWLGVGAGHADIAALATDAHAHLGSLGFASDAREFHPHVTLGRIKRPGSSLGPILGSLADAPACQSRVREIVLYRSVLGAAGSTYQPVRRIELGTHI